MLDALEARGIQIVPADARRLMLLQFDVLHLNFPTHYVTQSGPVRALASSVLFASVLLLARLRRRHIVYTVHDVVPLSPRNEWLLWRFYTFVLRCVDGYVFLSTSSRANFLEHFPDQAGKPWRLTPHGPYPAARLPAAERSTRHDAIAGRDALVIGFLGTIKPYKNIAALTRLPRRLADGRHVHLLIAGPSEPGQDAEIKAVVAELQKPNMTRLPATLSDKDLDVLVQSVDAVFLPYQRGSNSGAALLVLSNRSRLIGSSLPVFRQLAGELGAPWVFISEDTVEGWRSALEQVAAHVPDTKDLERLDNYLSENSFAAGADAVRSLYKDLIAQRS